MKILFCFLLTSLFFQTIHSQIKGQIIDETTKKPVPFAAVYYPNSRIGTSSDENGNFKIQSMSKELPGFDSLSVSCIGYASRNVEIKNSGNNQDAMIYLQPKVIELAEVIIKPGKRIRDQIVIDNADFSKHGHMYIGTKEAIYFKSEQPAARIMGISVKPREVCDSAALLLSFYSVKQDGTPDKMISKNRVLFTNLRNKKWNRIDLSAYNIFTDKNEFFVVLEQVSRVNNCFSYEWKSQYINKAGKKVTMNYLSEYNITLHSATNYKKYKVYYKYGNQEWQFYNYFVPLMKVDLEY